MKKIKLAVVAVIAGIMMCLPATAFAANVNGNVAYVNEGNLVNMTIVGEGADNHVVVTNTAASAPSPTGFVMANLPLFISARRVYRSVARLAGYGR